MNLDREMVSKVPLCLSRLGREFKNVYRRMVERLSHFIQGIILVTDVPPGALEPLLRRTLAEADPNLTITNVRTMQQQIEFSFDRERAVASLAELFGIVALVLAAVDSGEAEAGGGRVRVLPHRQRRTEPFSRR